MEIIKVGESFAHFLPFKGKKLHFSTIRVVRFYHDRLGVFAECEETYTNGHKNTPNPHWSVELMGEELRSGFLKRINH